jgi:Cysteine-rich CWC
VSIRDNTFSTDAALAIPAMPAAPLREPRCPLCGDANGCVPASTGTFDQTCDQTCWCAGLVIDRGVLARVPEPMKGRACLCARCAASDGQAAISL